VNNINFVVVTRLNKDKLCYINPLLEGDINKLKNWIRYKDKTSLTLK
jgi:hypothetical protein